LFSSDAAELVLQCPFSGPHSGSNLSSTWCVLLPETVFRSAYTVWQQAPARMHSVPDHWAIHSPENTGTWRFRSKPSPALRSCSPEAGSHNLHDNWHTALSQVFEFLFVLFRSVPECFLSWANGSFLFCFLVWVTLHVLSDYPLTNRRFEGGTAEPFSKNILKIFSVSVLQIAMIKTEKFIGPKL
jgi:hypothetical protein